MTQIQTISGLWFDFKNPQVDQISLHDIAWSESMSVRYGGHLYKQYNIADHSLNVCELLASWGCTVLEQSHGLMHDAPEAYTGDIVTPLKQLLSEMSSIEDRIYNVICEAFSLPLLDNYDIIHKADKYMYEVERFSGFVRNVDGIVDHGIRVTPRSQMDSYTQFMQKFFDLHAKL